MLNYKKKVDFKNNQSEMNNNKKFQQSSEQIMNKWIESFA